MSGYVPPQQLCRDQQESQGALRESGASGMATDQQPGSGDPARRVWANEQVTQLFRDHYIFFYRMVRRRGFSDDDAHDILNTCGAAVFTRLLDPEKPVLRNLLEYFNRVVQNQIAQYGRDRKREPADPMSDEILGALPDDRPSTSPGAATPLSPKRRALLAAALTALGELPEYLREPYEIEIYGGLKPAVIARILDLRPNTARSYLSIARATVKERVAELLQSGADGEEEDDE